MEPGQYTVKLKVGGKEFSQALTVLKDPNTTGTAADVKAQTKILLEIYENTNAVARMINQAERIRKQLRDLKTFLEGHPAADAVNKAGADIDREAPRHRGLLLPRPAHGFGDELRWPSKFYAKLGFLADQVASSDYPPTDQMIDVHRMFTSQLAAQQEKQRKIVEQDLAAFDRLLTEKKIPRILSDFKGK